MAKVLFNNDQIEALMVNPYVEFVSECRITYSDEFKKKFVEEYRLGKGPRQIFKDAGFDVVALGYKRIERAADRWRKANNNGELGEATDYVEVHRERNRRYRETLEDKCSRLEQELSELKSQLAALESSRA